MVKRWLGLGLGLAAIVAGCTLLNPLDGYTGGDAPVDAGVDPTKDTSPTPQPTGTADTSVPPEDAGCKHARPPARPTPSGNPDGGSLTVVSALSSFSFASAADPKNPTTRGYDLDNLCTCPDQRACVLPGSAGVCDFANGVDNSGGQILANLQSLGGGGSTLVSQGDDGLLVRIRNYNGLPDDEDVEVSLFDTFGAEVRKGPDAGTLKRDGSDLWTVDTRSLLGGTAYLPVAADTRAYVSGNVVVAELRFPFRIGAIKFPISQGYLTAKLQPKGTGYALVDGSLGGRMNTSEFLTALEVLPTPTGAMCGTDAFYTSIRDSVCKARDLPTDPTTDGREGPCDAISLILEFTAEPALLGRVMSPTPTTRPCGDSWVARCP